MNRKIFNIGLLLFILFLHSSVAAEREIVYVKKGIQRIGPVEDCFVLMDNNRLVGGSIKKNQSIVSETKHGDSNVLSLILIKRSCYEKKKKNKK